MDTYLFIVVRKGSAILKLFAGKDQSLFIWGNVLLVLDLSLDILNVVKKGTAILPLFPGKDQSLLIWGNALLVLDLCFNVLNGLGGFDL